MPRTRSSGPALKPEEILKKSPMKAKNKRTNLANQFQVQKVPVRAAEAQRPNANLNVSDRKAEVVFSFDTTTSMYPCLTQVRRKIKECVERLFREIGQEHLRIGVIAHGDYDTHSYVIKQMPMTTNVDMIVDFVSSVDGNERGRTFPECYELVLSETQKFAWLDGWSHVLVLIGDDRPHERDENPHGLDWREELVKLKNMGIVVHGVQALNLRYASDFYAECAKVTGGVHMPLDQFSAVVDLVMAVCYREARPNQLEAYEREIQAQLGRYSRSLRTMFDRMLGRDPSTSMPPGDMNAVPPGRFQVLEVDTAISIKDFVEAQGVNFQKGRGFYEFIKQETIQQYKEIILMDKNTGDMFEGPYARTLLGLPTDADAKANIAPQSATIKPGNLQYFVFIQSTSYNRKLSPGSRFLYEV
ncbi:hypothetical protein DdX_12978 [Ditylenchus destructor]|uniref:VWFA domain-containing protein n=1 Tax=Ditylenchus destructor TaxID=166010 RepID=A0AAD4MTR3_9BILA|nr:hypothetical protein DdX_12978 [Ditylenchus destructor]